MTLPSGIDVDSSFASNGRKRENADKKYGFGGKRGKFKKTDKRSLDDMSGYNPKGNFKGGMKKGATVSSGKKKRAGKRARDSGKSK